MDDALRKFTGIPLKQAHEFCNLRRNGARMHEYIHWAYESCDIFWAKRNRTWLIVWERTKRACLA